MNIDFKQFRKDFSNAVKQLEEQYSLTIEGGNIGFSDNDFTMKVICKKPQTNVTITKDDWFVKIGGRQVMIIDSVNGDNIKCFVKGKYRNGLYNFNKSEFLNSYSKLNN